MTAAAVASSGEYHAMDQPQRAEPEPEREGRAWARHELFKSRLVDMVDRNTLREMVRTYRRCSPDERRDVYRQLLRMVYGSTRGGRALVPSR